ncbi:DUF6090 family protein [Robiginitalea sp. SC105]|uniref:DUF6090 family protein n=1 Tax=Robiginitalea sp. SC105 TaxID=2762332 RepID=UPI00163A3D8F|nr:DUF6090 family protein [Robiginitalea sp. SC105]MBC2839776.1 hypothetical protein [Robiginitalea sp. SC105]
MITFFRKLRRRLLSENRVTRYMLYAFGEIVLVVIGILIALQINNWNESQKEIREEAILLRSLLADLEQAESQSDEMMQAEEWIIMATTQALGLAAAEGEPRPFLMNDSIAFEILWSAQTVFPVINAYKELQSSGRAFGIRDSSIRDAFTTLGLKLNDLQRSIADRIEVQQIRIDAILENEINAVRLLHKPAAPDLERIIEEREMPNDYDALLADRRVRSLLAMKNMLNYDVLDTRRQLHAEIQHLSGLIAARLNPGQTSVN